MDYEHENEHENEHEHEHKHKHEPNPLPIPIFRPPEGYQRLYLELAWHGAGFRGWQTQAMGERTVQGVLFEALESFGATFRPVASGRTDAGVHAYCMAAHVDVALDYPVTAPKLARALGSRLPHDVKVLQAKQAPPNFHARHTCVWREYRYRLDTRAQPHPLECDRALWFPYPLELEALQQGAELLLGEHDFAAFASQEDRQTVRKLLALEWVVTEGGLELRLRGKSFLRHMVRAIVGTLLRVGDGHMTLEQLQVLLERKKRGHSGKNVPAHGLHFWQAHYLNLDQASDLNLTLEANPDHTLEANYRPNYKANLEANLEPNLEPNPS
jgi:tRNA pseudouridine38-40 synthase